LASVIALTQVRVCPAQVRNIRFDDTNAASGTLSGIIYWEEPSGGLPNQDYSYDVLFADDASGTNPTATIGSVSGGAFVSELVLTNQATSSKTHLLVYLKDGGGSTSNPASIFLLDNTGTSKTVYFTTVGYAAASSAKAAVVTAGYALEHNIVIEMVATAVSTGAGTFTENDFGNCKTEDLSSSTAIFCVYFTTVHSTVTIANIETSVSSHTTSAPIPAVFTGSGIAASSPQLELGIVQAASIMDDFVVIRPDKDQGRYICKSVVEYDMAHAAMVNCAGDVRIITEAASQTAVTNVVNYFQGYTTANVPAITYANMGASTSSQSTFGASITQTTDVCTPVSSDASHTPCLGRDTL